MSVDCISQKAFFFMAVLVITHDSHLLISFWNTAANCSAYWAYWTSSVYDTSTPPPCTKSSWSHLLAIYFAPFHLSCLSHLSILVKLLLYVKLSQRCSLAPSCSSNNTAQRQLFFSSQQYLRNFYRKTKQNKQAANVRCSLIPNLCCSRSVCHTAVQHGGLLKKKKKNPK